MKFPLVGRTDAVRAAGVMTIIAMMTPHYPTDATMQCPGSNATVHAKCSMEVTFPETDCSTVIDEVKRRIMGDSGWLDPHNRGAYMLMGISETSHITTLTASRLTGDKKYTDLFVLTFSSSSPASSSRALVDSDNDQRHQACVMSACSESQVTSILDFSTNYCNLRNLYCSTHDGCPIVEHDLIYTEHYTSCRQRDVTKCLTSV